MRELGKVREQGHLGSAGRAWTVKQWLPTGVENIAALLFDPTPPMATGSRSISTSFRVSDPTGSIDWSLEYLEKIYARMMERGSAAGTAHQAHRTMRTALK